MYVLLSSACVPLDITIIIDGSFWVEEPNWAFMLRFVTSFIRMFTVGENDTRFAVIVADDELNVVFNLENYRDRDALVELIKELE